MAKITIKSQLKQHSLGEFCQARPPEKTRFIFHVLTCVERVGDSLVCGVYALLTRAAILKRKPEDSVVRHEKAPKLWSKGAGGL